MSPKSILAGVMVAGFLISIPLWLSSTTEDKQYLAQSAVKQLIEKNVGLLEIKPEEKEQLRKMLKPEAKAGEMDYEQVVWTKDIIQTIKPWVPDQTEAEAIARWVYIYAKRFNLSPELILGVIAVESRFDHFAVSNVGAIGLMQVMPFWKNELGSSDDNLLEIETNVRYGCAILRHYIDRYKKLDRALGAYNGSLGKNKYPNKIFAAMKRFKATDTGI
ncbi:murein transglycosylase C [Mariprofundus micogutta]|uniref:Murein transglycosylase C n=1 Tax=Mariprofundus micogutta TaxID=1921010 RepID=A0A1L8CR04_9PROT|nr:transglycosylase SLT domain-containing protein [Mariprofundus micogutta]GAV21304.1 murein transglycosylase C [Mariprofundus micogutta]